MNSLDITIIIASLVVVVVAGLVASRDQDKSAKGYFLASGKMPWWLIGAGFVATSVSSEQIVGTVGATYTHGMGIANWEWFAPNKFLMILIFVPIYLRNRVTTIPDLLARRYGPRCADIYSWVMLVAYVFIFMPPVLYGGSLAFSELTGWDFYAVLWTTIILVALYTVHGGLKAVMWTDAIQCVMLIGGGVLLFFSSATGKSRADGPRWSTPRPNGFTFTIRPTTRCAVPGILRRPRWVFFSSIRRAAR